MKLRRRTAKGAVLVEFALSALLLITVLLGTIEIGVQIYARNTTERLVGRVAQAYASTRSMSVAGEVLDNRTDAIAARCTRAPEFVLFDRVAGIDPYRDLGRPAQGTSADASAVAFRVRLTCDWPRLAPVIGQLIGGAGSHTAYAFARFRVEDEP